jgi:uncharacterized protein YdbL (DUF1318 family)
MNRSTIGAALLAAAFCLGPAMPQDPPAKQDPPVKQQPPQKDVRAELKDRMKARYPLLEALRDAGKVGETREGEAKLVKASHGSEQADPKDAAKGTVADLVAAENKDRRELYQLLSKELKVSPAEVGKQNGLRTLEKAKPDHWIEVNAQWVQRKSVKTVDGKGEPPGDKPGDKK